MYSLWICAACSSDQALNLWSQIRQKGIPLLSRSYFGYIYTAAAFIFRLRPSKGSGFALDFDFGRPKSVLGQDHRAALDAVPVAPLEVLRRSD